MEKLCHEISPAQLRKARAKSFRSSIKQSHLCWSTAKKSISEPAALYQLFWSTGAREHESMGAREHGLQMNYGITFNVHVFPAYQISRVRQF